MHGLVLPKHPTLNNYIGCLAVLLYALFSYTKLRKKHQEHHKFPASNKDPDFYDGKHKNFLVWYVNFLSNYLSLSQILGMAIIFNILKHLLGISTSNLLLFWVVPAISSTLQLSQAHSSYFISEPICSIVNWHRDTLIAIVLEAIAILSSSHSSLVIISVTIGNTMLILKSHGGSYLTLGNRKNFKPIYLTQKNPYHVYLFKKNHLIGISLAIPCITSDRRWRMKSRTLLKLVGCLFPQSPSEKSTAVPSEKALIISRTHVSIMADGFYMGINYLDCCH